MTFDDFIEYCEIDPKILFIVDTKFELEWKRKHVDWAQYVANMSLNDDWQSVAKWCKNNLTGRVDLCTPVYFELEEDLILFLLKWG